MLMKCIYKIRCVIFFKSSIPIPIHVNKAKNVECFTPNFVEPSVGFVVIFDELSVSAVAERGIGGVLAITELVVSALSHVELQWPASSHVGVAAAVAVWVVERDAA